jgi:adenylosuccinate lyase
MLDPQLFIGRSPELVQRYCGDGGPVQKKVAPYMDFIKNSTTAQINV